MLLVEETLVEATEPDITTSTHDPEPHAPALIEELHGLLEKLVSYTHVGDDDPEFAAGMEAGMARAADMLEGALKRATGDTR